MPPLPLVPYTYRVAVTGIDGGQPWANIFHLKASSDVALSSGDMVTLAGDVLTAFETNIYPVSSDSFGVREVEVVPLSSVSRPVGVASSSGVGALSGQPAPSSVARLVSWKINRRFRGGHPRTYFAGALASQLDAATSQVIDTTPYANFISAVNGFFVDMNSISVGGLSFEMAMVSYYAAGALRTTPLVDVINDFEAEQKIATQRRRLIRSHS